MITGGPILCTNFDDFYDVLVRLLYEVVLVELTQPMLPFCGKDDNVLLASFTYKVSAGKMLQALWYLRVPGTNPVLKI